MSAPALTDDHPFPGLRPFGFNDHKYFFGRDEQIYALYRLVTNRRFVAVVGSSGSGKSSLVSAGLLPLLQGEAESARDRPWFKVEIRPGDTPIRRLADKLARLGPPLDDDQTAARSMRIAFHLRESTFGVADSFGEIGLPDGAALILVIDQFEELFRYARSPQNDEDDEHWSRDEAEHFVQLLLEASRIPDIDVRVLLTMRSDFIGDCSRFPGLPEAVSAAQFLVPGLTHDQREEVIRQPLLGAKVARGAEATRKPHATIEQALVQTLLNAGTNDLDQLPVLQHCLLRLWDEAGQAARIGQDPGPAAQAPDQPASPVLRHLTLKNYQDIGRMEGALSQHAEEILKKLPGLTLAVEQTFRALAEIDRDKRVIRRPRLFEELRDEVVSEPKGGIGVSEADLRDVLNRFRADDCSFLLPSPSAVPKLESDTRVDVGHEALLRRWERVSGIPAATAAGRTDAGAIGWLRAEEQDGQRYRSLLNRLDSNRFAVLSGKDLKDTVAWWKSRPRPAAWAARYGGGIDDITLLIKRSQTRKKIWICGVAASVAGLLLCVAYLFQRELQYRALLERDAAISINSAKTLLGGVLDSLNSGTMSAAGADRMSRAADEIVRNVRAAERTPETAALEVSLWLVDSDVKMTLGRVQYQLGAVIKARDTSREYLAKTPDNPIWLSLLYGSLFRIGDALAALRRTPQDIEDSMAAYQDAETVARTLAARPDNKGDKDRDVATMLGKIGDVWQIKGQSGKALEAYQAGVDVLKTLIDREPTNQGWQRSLAAAIDRLGQALAGLKRYDEALDQYRRALAIREEWPDERNDIYQLNIALSHTNIGRALRDKSDLGGALVEFNKALAVREALFEKDPNNALWQSYLADIYGIKGEILARQDDKNVPEVIELYRKSYELRRKIAARDPGNPAYLRNLTYAGNRIAKILADQSQPDEAIKIYRSMLDTETNQLTKPDDYAKQRRVVDLHITIGDLLAAQNKSDHALKDYRAALDIITQVTARLPADDAKAADWSRLRESIDEKVRKLAPAN